MRRVTHLDTLDSITEVEIKKLRESYAAIEVDTEKITVTDDELSNAKQVIREQHGGLPLSKADIDTANLHNLLSTERGRRLIHDAIGSSPHGQHLLAEIVNGLLQDGTARIVIASASDRKSN